jgi:hypothetical protein
MPYLIDGHNLIPHIRGLSLDQLDDELALVDRLDAYFQGLRKKAVVYFDRAQPGGSADIQHAFLKVHFVRRPVIADDAILRHLKKLGGEARNWVVVSSDLAVQRGAKKYGARVLSSAAFAQTIDDKKAIKSDNPAQNDEIDEWLRIFSRKS